MKKKNEKNGFDLITTQELEERYWPGVVPELKNRGTISHYKGSMYTILRKLPDSFKLQSEVNQELYSQPVDNWIKLLLSDLTELKELYSKFIEQAGEDYHGNEVPGIERAENLLSDITEEILGAISFDELPEAFLASPMFIPPASLPYTFRYRAAQEHEEEGSDSSRLIHEVDSIIYMISGLLDNEFLSGYLGIDGNDPLVADVQGAFGTVLDIIEQNAFPKM